MPGHDPDPPDATIDLPEMDGRAPAKGFPAAVIVSVAAVAVTGLIGTLGIVNTRNSQAYEAEKSEREFRLNCVTSGATIAQMAFTLAKDFTSVADSEKINQVNIIIASFPPDAASRFLTALRARMGTAASVIRAFQTAQKNLATLVEAEQHVPCPAAPPLISFDEPIADPAPVAPSNLVMPGAGPALGAAPPPPAARKLEVYYQITQPGDRGAALAVAQGVAQGVAHSPGPPGATTSFPAMGVELVALAKPLAQTEIRYYHADQADAADDLRAQLLARAKAANLELGARTVYIGAQYPNLPAGRIEVWFQPLTAARQG